MVLMETFNTFRHKYRLLHHRKVVSQRLLPYKSFHNNRDIFYDEMTLIFFMNTIAKPHVKRLPVSQLTTTALFHNSLLTLTQAFHSSNPT